MLFILDALFSGWGHPSFRQTVSLFDPNRKVFGKNNNVAFVLSTPVSSNDSPSTVYFFSSMLNAFSLLCHRFRGLLFSFPRTTRRPTMLRVATLAAIGIATVKADYTAILTASTYPLTADCKVRSPQTFLFRSRQIVASRICPDTDPPRLLPNSATP